MNILTALLFGSLTLGTTPLYNFATPTRTDTYSVVSQLPAQGRISSHFGWRIHPVFRFTLPHLGIDIANRPFTAIYATGKGRVRSVGVRGGYGLMIEVDHGHGWVSRYAHLSQSHVQRGAWVWPGAIIGSMGASGTATASHLHYELRHGQQAIDPLPYFAACCGPPSLS